ncbi:MAG: hypothetical protein ACOX69_07515 [Coriobacteriales bacterium]
MAEPVTLAADTARAERFVDFEDAPSDVAVSAPCELTASDSPFAGEASWPDTALESESDANTEDSEVDASESSADTAVEIALDCS